ncbi:hypothetical protein Dsin_024002 [Dipteronia sinensis]|uniref:Disease resistance protein At4g27190-like leucine-rich repeats domain-containing protein n=1 Tax=Dipteronia sinensis TaxID=43782 RepID=A0AAE0A5A9_9ROSI|nr:hypothetical protein Dsin_024002 [Dipteronia sinensis]
MGCLIHRLTRHCPHSSELFPRPSSIVPLESPLTDRAILGSSPQDGLIGASGVIRGLLSATSLVDYLLDSCTTTNCSPVTDAHAWSLSIEEIFDIQGTNPEEKRSTVATTHLRNLYIKNLPSIKRIWNKDPRGMLSFGNLLKIQVLECHDLKNLFPASVARSLSKLEYLSVCDCIVLKEIVAEERFVEEAAATRFIFPRMAMLELYSLPGLRTFYRR